MNIYKTIAETQEYLKKIRQQNLSVGFVPTMGTLHEGHLSLIRQAKKDTNIVAVSIFVNPIQFNKKNDFESYPHELDSDIEKLIAEDCDLLFCPSVAEMYPKPDNTQFDFGELDCVMEGQFRPKHFNGVAIVVKKLFEIIKPDKAYFGQKDYQQLVVIQQLVKDYNILVDIIPCPTFREKDGLAMSSRNKLLSGTEREIAPFIYKTLTKAKKLTSSLSVEEIKLYIEDEFSRVEKLNFEYVEIVDMISLKPIKNWNESENIIACIAAYLGNVRLIDNIILF